MAQETVFIVIMASYLGLLILWGVFQGRKVKSSSDYAIAGRKLPGWVAALSERATGESSWALLGLPGAAYATGLVEIWTAIGCLSGIITAWVLLAWRLRRAAAEYNVNTFTQFISCKHGELANTIRLTGSITIVLVFFFYVAAQFLGGGKSLESMFGISPVTGMLITVAIIVPYTIYGGLQSVVYTDVIQAIIMIITLVLGPIFGIKYLMDNPDIYAANIGIALDKASEAGNYGYNSIFGGAKGFGAGIMIATGFSWFFGYLGGQPQLSMRFMAIRDDKQAKRARNIGVIWTVFAYVGALTLGWIGIAIFGPNGLSDAEQVMPEVIMRVFPAGIAALLITGAIAAMISTADSLLILSSTELSENLIAPLTKSKINPQKSLKLSRLITAGLALIATLIAYIVYRAGADNIFSLVGYVWAFIGCPYSVVILLTLFWKKYHGRAAVITIIGGMLFTVVWIAIGMDTIITSRIITFFFSLLLAIIASVAVPKAIAKQNQ
ncbi:MAG TPA: sodium/proline symporter [Bacteroidales bacterium]|nr:sodium/proline symporter [Bacteroidales bacterium]